MHYRTYHISGLTRIAKVSSQPLRNDWWNTNTPRSHMAPRNFLLGPHEFLGTFSWECTRLQAPPCSYELFPRVYATARDSYRHPIAKQVCFGRSYQKQEISRFILRWEAGDGDADREGAYVSTKHEEWAVLW
jgi:hypothetical protein